MATRINAETLTDIFNLRHYPRVQVGLFNAGAFDETGFTIQFDGRRELSEFVVSYNNWFDAAPAIFDRRRAQLGDNTYGTVIGAANSAEEVEVLIRRCLLTEILLPPSHILR